MMDAKTIREALAVFDVVLEESGLAFRTGAEAVLYDAALLYADLLDNGNRWKWCVTHNRPYSSDACNAWRSRNRDCEWAWAVVVRLPE